jgi:hypothetical protein
MKKVTLLLICISILQMTRSQDKVSKADLDSESLVGIYATLGLNQPFYFNKPPEGNWFQCKESFSFGVNYLKTLIQNLKIDAGIYYYKYNIRIEAPDDPDIPEIAPYTESLAMVTIPIQIRFYFPKNYFFSFGSLIDFNLPRDRDWPDINPQSGFGLTLGAGKEIIINNFTLDIIPNLGIHSLIPFRSKENQQRLFEAGLKIGINYKIN